MKVNLFKPKIKPTSVGFIFLIKAAGLSSNEILKKLNQRLQNNLAIEKVIVHEQLAAIALLRLSQEVHA